MINGVVKKKKHRSATHSYFRFISNLFIFCEILDNGASSLPHTVIQMKLPEKFKKGDSSITSEACL